jgi:hypothetical protein
MSGKIDKSVKGQRESKAGKWILSYATKRGDRLNDFRDFKDDVEITHEIEVGPEPGSVLRTGKCAELIVPPMPRVPIESDFILKEDETKSAKPSRSSSPVMPAVDERAFKTALLEHTGKVAEWQSAIKAATGHKSKCESQYLPAIFAWLMSRLDHDLKGRLSQEQQFETLNDAYPKDPCALLELIGTVMSKGVMNDEASDNFELIRDMFSADALMKDQQTLVDYAKVIKDKMQRVQSKAVWKFDTTDDTGTVTGTRYAFDEEFFVLLMYHGLSKKYNTAKIEYSNDVASMAITRCKMFDNLINHFSQVRSTTTGDTVSASTLTTTPKHSKPKPNKDGKGKTSAKSDSKFNPKLARPCKHCNGAHWDNKCTSDAAKAAQKAIKATKDAKSNTQPSNDGPTQDEISRVLAHLREKESRKAATLAIESKQDAAKEELKYLLAAYSADI